LAIGEIDAAAATIEQASAEMQMHANNFLPAGRLSPAAKS
jgi:hypothetical protein